MLYGELNQCGYVRTTPTQVPRHLHCGSKIIDCRKTIQLLKEVACAQARESGKLPDRHDGLEMRVKEFGEIICTPVAILQCRSASHRQESRLATLNDRQCHSLNRHCWPT